MYRESQRCRQKSAKKKEKQWVNNLQKIVQAIVKFLAEHKGPLTTVIICVCYMIVFIVGRLLSIRESFRFSLVHQIVLIFLSFLQLYMLNQLRYTVKQLLDSMSGYNIVIHQAFKTLDKRIKSKLNYFWPILPAILFARKQITMGYVPFSPVGIYGVALAGSTFYIGLICYGKSFLAMLTVRRISRLDSRLLSFDFPDDTLKPPDWLVTLYSLFRKAQYAFVTAGMLYTLEYILLMPPKIISYDVAISAVSINASDPIGFVVGWLVIVILIIVAIPLFMSYFQNLFRQLVKNLKLKASQELRTLFGDSGVIRLESIYTLFSLNNEMMKDGNYLIKSRSLYPTIATSISLLINLIKLAEFAWPTVSLLLP